VSHEPWYVTEFTYETSTVTLRPEATEVDLIYLNTYLVSHPLSELSVGISIPVSVVYVDIPMIVKQGFVHAAILPNKRRLTSSV
jgi:hypothetical protein